MFVKTDRLRNVTIQNEFIEIKNAFRGNLRTFFYRNNNSIIKDICLLLINLKYKIADILNRVVLTYNAVKFNILVECTYIKPVINKFQDNV